jgi:hypothetical protein
MRPITTRSLKTTSNFLEVDATQVSPISPSSESHTDTAGTDLSPFEMLTDTPPHMGQYALKTMPLHQSGDKPTLKEASLHGSRRLGYVNLLTRGYIERVGAELRRVYISLKN